MNFISHDEAYCLYPLATFEDDTALPFSRERASDRTVWDKYAGRGWTLLLDGEPEIASLHSYYIGVPRHVGDGLCWKVTLDALDVYPRAMSYRRHSWKVSTRYQRGFFINMLL